MKEGGVTISIKNLLYCVLLRWRIMFIIAVVFAVLGNCLGIYKDYARVKEEGKTGSTVFSNPIDKLSEDANLAREMLTTNELLDVEEAFNIKQNYEELYQSVKTYTDESILMKIDYNNVPTGSLRYYVDADNPENKDNITQTLVDVIPSEMMMNQMAEAIDSKPEYVRELISIYENAGLLCVDLIGENEEQCYILMKIVKQRVKEAEKDIAMSIPSFNISFVSESFGYQSNEVISSTKLNKIDALNNLRFNIISIPNTLNENQKQYYNAQLELRIAKSLSEEELKERYDVSEASALSISFVHSKYILAGFLAGLLGVCLFAIFAYLLKPVLRVPENISRDFGQSVLGTVWAGNRKKKALEFVDAWLTKCFYGRESGFEYDKCIDILSTELRVAMDKDDIKSLYLTGTSEKGTAIIKDIVKRMGEDYNVICGENIIYNPNSLKNISTYDSVVFVEVTGESRLEEVSKEIIYADRSKIGILGFVLLQQYC